MLVECTIKQKSQNYIDEYKKRYAKVLEKVKVKGLQFRGRTIANAEWRIA